MHSSLSHKQFRHAPKTAKLHLSAHIVDMVNNTSADLVKPHTFYVLRMTEATGGHAASNSRQHHGYVCGKYASVACVHDMCVCELVIVYVCLRVHVCAV